MLDRQSNLKLLEFADLIKKWNNKINLISKKDISNIWERHILDSAQLSNYINDDEVIADLGSGAGFPGIILSIIKVKTTILIESDTRKCAFLSQAKKISNNEIEIVNKRIENSSKYVQNVDVFTSRGLSSIDNILSFNINKNRKKFLLLKGESHKLEIEDAKKNWDFDIKIYDSITNPKSAILEIYNVRKKI